MNCSDISPYNKVVVGVSKSNHAVDRVLLDFLPQK